MINIHISAQSIPIAQNLQTGSGFRHLAPRLLQTLCLKTSPIEFVLFVWMWTHSAMTAVSRRTRSRPPAHQTADL
ncbi:hypothetical protein Q8A67_023715 [Cirrhinus molitorella]|uniref:Uncharacterized protein n=1 Tax=Cirrhinus molitorella TaxID=172907 RepID=A0AA88P821_9TELE|nr:hypothetical protein Q8A67_023715 [Cirrhinus molitorella]